MLYSSRRLAIAAQEVVDKGTFHSLPDCRLDVGLNAQLT